MFGKTANENTKVIAIINTKNNIKLSRYLQRLSCSEYSTLSSSSVNKKNHYLYTLTTAKQVLKII